MGAAPHIGRVVDHYSLLEKLGEGGMGIVWLAEDTRLRRKVAIKFLPPEAARDAVRRQRFEQEARAAAALSHPGIATVHELAETEGQTYIVFEYVPGTTLRSLVVPGGLRSEELLDIAGDIAHALAAAHSAGVVHRDLKPENVMRTPAGACKVLDFGLARLTATAVTPESATETRSHLTSAGMLVGTVGYMAPEQLDRKEVDFRCDIFSFGTLVYELATGVHPFQGGSAASTIAAIMTAEPPPITERNRLQPAELERIVRKCLRKRREERYQSTQDLAVDLANLKRDSDERTSSVAAVAAASPMAEDDSLLRRMFSSIGASPRRWWELYQLFGIFVYAPVAFRLALGASARISYGWGTALTSNWHGWQGMIQDIASGHPISSSIWWNFGLAFFLVVVLLLTTTVATRLYLVWLAVIVPERLLMDVRTVQAVLRVVYSVLACQLAFIGLILLRAGELIMGTGLVAFALGTLLAVSYAEPEMVRAAFPQAFTEVKRDRSRTLRIRVAAAHLGYALLLVAPVASGKLSLEEIMQGINLHPTAAQLALFAYSVVMTVGCIALLISAVQMLTEGVPGLRVFRRWFAAYLAIDLVATGAWIWLAFNSPTPAVIAIGLTIILLALPFGQLRMARQALRESGEVEQETVRSRRDPRFTQIAGVQMLMVALYIGMLYLAAKAGALEAGPAALVQGEYATGLGYVLAAPILIAALVSSAALVVRSLQGNTQALRIFLRLFPGYWLLGQAWYVPLIWIAVRKPTILVSLVLAPPFAALPFYQRWLARDVLRESGELKEEQPLAQPSHRLMLPTWWWLHHLATLFATTPAVMFTLWKTRPLEPLLLSGLRQPLFLLESLALGLHWSVRFALVSGALGNPAGLEKQVVRMRRWILWTGWPVVVGLGAIALNILPADEVVAAIIGVLAMGGVVCLVFLDPAVERAAFPSA